MYFALDMNISLFIFLETQQFSISCSWIQSDSAPVISKLCHSIATSQSVQVLIMKYQSLDILLDLLSFVILCVSLLHQMHYNMKEINLDIMTVNKNYSSLQIAEPIELYHLPRINFFFFYCCYALPAEHLLIQRVLLYSGKRTHAFAEC